MSYGMIGVAVVGGLVSMSQGAANRRQAEGMADDAKLEREQ